MPKDYAKNRSRKPAPRRMRFVAVLVWLGIGVLLGLVLSGTYQVKKHIARLLAPPTQSTASHGTLLRDPFPQKVKPHEEAPKEEKVDFDFYTILPNSDMVTPPKKTEPAKKKPTEVSLPTPDLHAIPPPAPPKAPVVRAKPTTLSETPIPTKYILQLGAFKTFEEADQLKAQLSLMGLQANIKRSTVGNTTWHHVWMGIYPTRASAEKIQRELMTYRIRSSISHVKS